jgi:hypothetical protein
MNLSRDRHQSSQTEVLSTSGLVVTAIHDPQSARGLRLRHITNYLMGFQPFHGKGPHMLL